MKKTLITTVVSVCSLIMAASTALAAPSIYGPTGLINTPTADALREGQFSIGYHHLEEANVGSFNLNLLTNLEVGITRIDPDQAGATTTFNAKWALMPETTVSPGLAIGVEDIGNEYDRTPYVVASKALPLGFRVHAGLGGGRYDGKMFAAVEKTINPVSIITGNSAFPATTLIAEYDGKDMNYAARMSILPGLKAEAGWRGWDEKMYYGLSFTY